MNLDEFRSLYDFTDRTILITGGAGVLGAAIAQALMGCNANVVILNRNKESAKKVMQRFPRKSKGRATQIIGDVFNPETLHQANESIIAGFGAVDILFNAAGGNHPSASTSNELSCFDSRSHAFPAIALFVSDSR